MTTTRAMPYEDLAALLGVVAVLDGQLVGGELPPELTARLVRRLTEHGPLPDGATAGSLNAALSDLAQRLHWAMGGDMDYPPAMAHRTSYRLGVGAGSIAAAMDELRDAGAEDVRVDAGAVVADFPELAPDPAYADRVVQLSALAERHGGSYEGAGW